MVLLTPEQRFWPKVDKGPGCWTWNAATTKHGYSVFNDGSICTSGHRFSWRLHYGPIPDGYEVNHECHNHSCVRPTHLRLTDKNDNGAYRKGPTTRSKSGIRDVFWWKNKQRWVGRIRYRGKDYSTGVKRTAAEAEEAVIALRRKVFGVDDYNPDDWELAQ